MNNSMDSAQLLKTIKTKRFQLYGWRLFKHYSPCLLFSIPPLFLMFLYIKSIVESNFIVSKKLIEDQLFFWLFFIIVIILFVIKYRELDFKIITANHNYKGYKTAIHNTAKVRGWTTVTERNNFYKAFSDKRLFTWGEEITIIKTEEYILFNSMNSLIFHPSLLSFIENKANLKTFKKNLASS